MLDANKPVPDEHEENAEKISVPSEVERTKEREAAVDTATQSPPQSLPQPPMVGEPAEAGNA